MGFKINYIEQEDNMSKVKLKQRTYKTADGKAVPEGDPRAAFLVASEGKEISEEEAKELGITKSGNISASNFKDDPEEKNQGKEGTEDKSRKQNTENKGSKE